VAALARVLVISFSNLASDPRVDRQLTVLLARHEVTAAGLAAPTHDGLEFVDISTPPLGLVEGGLGVARLLAHRFEAAYWRHPKNCEVLRRLQGVAADVVLANDLAALPIALSLGPPVVFDAHEFAPDELSDRLWWRTLIAPYVEWQCRRYLPQAAAMTTVGGAIADEYERSYGAQAAVVTNAPPYADLHPRPVVEPIRVLHHGIAQRGRGLEEMLHLAGLLDDRFTVDFVLAGGSSRFRDELVGQARDNARVTFPPPVPMRELVSMANAYDVGLFLLPPNNLNRRYALPNKFFEFVQARLAVAVGPSPEMAALVRRHGLGVVAADFTPEALAAELNSLDADQIAGFKLASDAAACELSAERNAEAILSAIDTALASTVHVGSDAA
jgi:glycosyl transferase family 4